MALVIPAMAQPDTIAVQEVPDVPEVPEVPEVSDFPEVEPETDMEFETPDKTRVTVGENEIFIIEDSGDTTRLQLGKKGMSIVEAEDGYKIDIME